MSGPRMGAQVPQANADALRKRFGFTNQNDRPMTSGAAPPASPPPGGAVGEALESRESLFNETLAGTFGFTRKRKSARAAPKQAAKETLGGFGRGGLAETLGGRATGGADFADI
jgi:uncharacterized membrane protein